MQVYLVGGAVRDRLLDLTVKDKDFVVVGATPDELLSQGFQQVGASFPVFLHPKTHNEYALARLERKIGAGHKGFVVNSNQHVSLEDDLLRRDLTINALAMPVAGLFDDSITGGVIDYYGGIKDLQDKKLRHVSPAFAEDPLRVLRVARFYARFYSLGFTVDGATEQLMQQLARSGELQTLSRERLWSEVVRAMQEQHGFAFWELLWQLDIVAILLPKLAINWQDELRLQRTFTLLQASYDKPIAYSFAMLVSGFFTAQDTQSIADCATRLAVPKHCQHFAILVCESYSLFTRPLTAKSIVPLIERTKAHNDSTTLRLLIVACYHYLAVYELQAVILQAVALTLFEQAIISYRRIGINDIDPNLTGQAIGSAILTERLRAIEKLLIITKKD